MQVQSQRIETPDLSIKNHWSSNNAQAIVESLVDPLFILDEHGVILEVNSYAEELFEYSREELIGNINISKLIPLLNLDNEETRSKYFEKSIITTGLRKSLHDEGSSQIDIDVSITCYADKDGMSTSTNNLSAAGFYVVSVRDITRQLTEIEWSKSRYHSEFKEIKCIGKGGFGSVYLAKNKLDEQVYAIKKIPLQCHPQDYIECMNLMNSEDEKLHEDEYGCSSGNCSKCNIYSQENYNNFHDDEKIIENMKTSLTLDDLRVIREVKNFAKFKSHPNVVRYYASWVEPVLLNDELQEISDSKVNSAQRSQENLVSPFDHVHPNTPVDPRNRQDVPGEHYSIYDSINVDPLDTSQNNVNTKTNNNYLNNQNQSLNNYTTSNSKSNNMKTHFEKEDEDFDIFGNGPSDLRMITSLPKSFIEDSNSNNTPLQQHSQQNSYNYYNRNSKEKEILDFMPSSFEAYSSFDPHQSTNSSLSNNISNNRNILDNNTVQLHTTSMEKQPINSKSKNGSSDNISQYNINVRNFYKNCDNQHSFSNDNIDCQNNYSTIHESHSYNNLIDSSSRNGQSSSHYTNEPFYDNHQSDSASTLSDDDESSLTLLELPVINSSNEEINMLSSSQTNLNTYSENELTTSSSTDEIVAVQNTNSQTLDEYNLEDKEEVVTQFSEKDDDIFLTRHEEDESCSSENGELPLIPRDTSKSFEHPQNYNSCGGINIPNKGENRRHQSDNETCNSYNSTYSNNSIKTMLLDNQFSLDDRKNQMLKTQNVVCEESLSNPCHNEVMDGELCEDCNNSNNNVESYNNNANEYYDDEFSSGSSVSTIVDDCDLAKNTIYQIPAATMLYIQMEYSSPNNLRKWIRERNANIWKHAPFLNNEEDTHVKHSKHWFLDYINRKKNLNLLQQITLGLEHIHKSGFIHRDIKPANIFMSEDRVMIGDFGLAKRYVKGNSDYDINDLAITDEGDNEDHLHHLEMLMKEEIAKDNNYSMKTVKSGGEQDLTLGVGTLLYASPEQLSRKPYSFATDIYSLSVIMLELFFPFCTSFDRMAHLVNLRKGEIPDCLKKRWPEECDLLLSMANADPYQRPTATEILHTINQLLTNQPARISSINSLYLPKRYNLFNPVFHSNSSASTIREVDNQSEDSFLTSNDIMDQTISNANWTTSPELEDMVICNSEVKSEKNENGKDDKIEEVKESEKDKETINLLIDKLYQLQLTDGCKESSLNDLITPVLEILTKKRNKINSISANHQIDNNNPKELNTPAGKTSHLYNSSKSLDSYLNTSSLNKSQRPVQRSSTLPISDNHQLQLMVNGVEASIDHDEDSDDITPQPSKISSRVKSQGPSPNQSHRSLTYIETKGYKLGTGMNDPLTSSLPPHDNSTNHLSTTNYTLFMPDKGVNHNSNPHMNQYIGMGRRRNSYSPTHSNEYYLNKLKGIDHDSYYLTSPPSTSQREGLLFRHEPFMSGPKFLKRNNSRRSSLPNPNRLSYNKDYSSSSSSKPSSSTTFYAINRTNKFNTFNPNVISEEEVFNSHHNSMNYGTDNDCQCEKCSEHESLVLGLLAENATLAKRIKELERRINSNNNSISPFGYHRNGKLK